MRVINDKCKWLTLFDNFHTTRNKPQIIQALFNTIIRNTKETTDGDGGKCIVHIETTENRKYERLSCNRKCYTIMCLANRIRLILSRRRNTKCYFFVSFEAKIIRRMLTISICNNRRLDLFSINRFSMTLQCCKQFPFCLFIFLKTSSMR